MADFTPKLRTSEGTGAATATNTALRFRTGTSSETSSGAGAFLVNAYTGHISYKTATAATAEIPIASDVIISSSANSSTDLTANNARLHRLAVITDGVASTPGDGIVRSVNGRTPDANGDITTLTYSDVGAAAVTHTHTKAEITDLLTEFENIGRVCTGTLSHINNDWTISVTTVNGIEKSNIYTDVVLSPIANTNLTQNSVVWVDINPDAYDNTVDYQTYLNEWQYIYKIAYQGTSQIRIYSGRIPAIDIPLTATILY